MKRLMMIGGVLLGIALAVLASPALAQGPNPTPPAPYRGPQGYGWGMGGMMSGWGMGGMTGGWGMGGWGGYGYGYGYAPNVTTLSLDQAVTSVKQYVAALNNSDLELVQVDEYAENFYGLVREKSTGTGALQVLVDNYTGAVSPEYGPDMMWNTKYSPMAWAGGGFWLSGPTAQMPVTLAQARENAAQYLKLNVSGTTVEEAGDTSYGYYNFDVLQNGKTYGMLSVNGYTGAVWYHTWHGSFIAKKELD